MHQVGFFLGFSVLDNLFSASEAQKLMHEEKKSSVRDSKVLNRASSLHA